MIITKSEYSQFHEVVRHNIHEFAAEGHCTYFWPRTTRLINSQNLLRTGTKYSAKVSKKYLGRVDILQSSVTFIKLSLLFSWKEVFLTVSWCWVQCSITELRSLSFNYNCIAARFNYNCVSRTAISYFSFGNLFKFE